MKFVHAEQELEMMVAEIEKYIQNKAFTKDELVLVCSESHRSSSKSMVEIAVDTFEPADLKEEDSHPLEKYHIEKSNLKLYDDMVAKGGYVLLAKEDSTPAHKEEMKTSLANSESDNADASHKKEIEDATGMEEDYTEDSIKAPGFGVNQNEPRSDAETHEDVFNPEDPNPDHRR